MADTAPPRVVLITGAGGGIGRAIGARFSADGDLVVLGDVSESHVKRLESDFPGALALRLDVTDQTSVANALNTIQGVYGQLDVLVNNAGVLRTTRAVDISLDEWHLVLEVNLTGAFICSRAAYPLLGRSTFGRIINMSSTAGKSTSTVGGVHYTAAKAGLLGLTRHMAREFAVMGITVNAVCPGLIDTEMVSDSIGTDRSAAYANSFPIPRLGRPGEVADLVAFLASESAGYITGASMDINGGDLTI